MAYVGQAPFQEFTNPPTKDSFTGDGSTTTFDMASEVPSASQNALEVYVDNVRQEPGSGKAFTLGVDGSGDTKRITFSSAPANGASIYVINDKTNSTIVAPLQNDLNGTELILDANGDTSITADTDDRIDFKIANVEHFSFSNSSGDTVIKPMVDAKDILFQQYDGRTLLDINDGGYVAIANGATGPGQLRLYEDTDNGTNYTAFQVGTQSGDVTYTLPTADGTDGYQLTTDGSGTLSWAVAGAAMSGSTNNTICTVTGANAFQGESNLTFDGSTLAVTGAATVSTTLGVTGALTGSSTIQGTTITATTAFVPDASDGAALGTTSLEFSDLYLADGAVIGFGDDQEVTLTHVADTGLLLSSTDRLQFGDSGTYIHQSADGVLDLVSDTELELNATTIDINGNVEISGTLAQVGVATFTARDIHSGGITIANDGQIGSVGDADAIAISSSGVVTMTQIPVLSAGLNVSGGTIAGTVSTATQNSITTMTGLVTTGALNSGSIATGFGNIDNGSSNITSGGLVKLDVDADADDVSGDSSTGRLTIGAGEDLNLYHGGTNSYIVNDTGDLILKTGASDEDMIFQGNDGGSAITALTLDMSAAGAAAFNSTVTATGFIIGSANINEAELETIDGITAGTVIASKALVADANIDITGGRNITISGELDAATGDFSGDVDIDGTLETDALSIDGTAVTATAAEINLIDGGTARGTTAVADADGFLVNDGGTMRMTSAATVQTYMQDGAGFASGTDMVFFQTAAPTGWTKSTANNDKALRVVSGNGGGTGGSAAFSSPAHNLTAAAHTLATNEIPSHSHSGVVTGASKQLEQTYTGNSSAHMVNNVNTGSSSNAGGGGSHTHNSSGSITTPHYIDVIVCAKD